MAINYVPSLFTCDQIIPMNITDITKAGTMTMSFSQLETLQGNFDIKLVDSFNSTTMDVTSDLLYEFNVDPADATTFGKKRFYLIVAGGMVNHNVELASSMKNRATETTHFGWRHR